MKNILVGPAHPLRGGIANFNESLHTQYLAQGDDSRIISYSLQYPNFLFPGKTQFALDKAPVGLHISTRLNSVNPFSWISVGREIRKAAPDVVVIHYWMPFFAPALGTICRIVKRNKKTKIVALCHNVKPHEKQFGERTLARYFMKKCDGFLVMSKSTLDDLNLYTNNQNKLFVPHPIYDTFGKAVSKKEARNHLGLEPDGKYLLFFGVVRKYKGLDLLLESMGEKLLHNYDVKLIIAGEFYDDPAQYEEIIAKHNIGHKIVIRNSFISANEVKYYFCASDLITQTYHTATQSGISQIAYHFEIPMLVTDVGGLAEIVPHEKVGYVSSQSTTEIAGYIHDFFENKRAKTFIENIKIEKKRFTWENLTAVIKQLLDNC